MPVTVLKFKDGDIDCQDYRQSIVNIFVSTIFLYVDLLVITFYVKDGTQMGWKRR